MEEKEKKEFTKKVFYLMREYDNKYGNDMTSSLLANMLTIELNKKTPPKELKGYLQDVTKLYEKRYNEDREKEAKDESC